MAGLRIESPLTSEQEELVNRIIGAAIEVHSKLGPGFLEKIYEHALCYELKLRGIPF
jgi:GxxExxY protein